MTIVDIHCHTFNADDLPVKGFIGKVVGNKRALVRLLDRVVDTTIQGIAVSAAKEQAELDQWLARPGRSPFEELPPDLAADVERQVDEIITGLDEAGLDDLADAEAELAPTGAGPSESLEGLGDRLGDVKRYMRWAALFGKRRVDLTEEMINTYPEVDLFTPLLVDFQGLGDRPNTSIVMQFELQEKISRLSMRGDLGAAVHPFVGFDPRRPDAMRNARLGIEGFGCIGVKMYPPMGFRPLGNRERVPAEMDGAEAERVDRLLGELYSWCEAEQVPITAHCNPTNYADDAFEEFSHPDNWAEVLAAHPDLHLNLGHFGWSGRDRGWTTTITELAKRYDHLYADIGNHEVEELDESFVHFRELFEPGSGVDPGPMIERLMFGTDWFMVAGHRQFEEFLTRFRSEFEAAFPGRLDSFMGGAALAFLGFDDPDNGNTRRLTRRYTDNGFEPPSWLATSP